MNVESNVRRISVSHNFAIHLNIFSYLLCCRRRLSGPCASSRCRSPKTDFGRMANVYVHSWFVMDNPILIASIFYQRAPSWTGGGASECHSMTEVIENHWWLLINLHKSFNEGMNVIAFVLIDFVGDTFSPEMPSHLHGGGDPHRTQSAG